MYLNTLFQDRYRSDGNNRRRRGQTTRVACTDFASGLTSPRVRFAMWREMNEVTYYNQKLIFNLTLVHLWPMSASFWTYNVGHANFQKVIMYLEYFNVTTNSAGIARSCAHSLRDNGSEGTLVWNMFGM